MSQKRWAFVDIAKLLAIVGVVFDHSQYFVSPSEHFMVLRIWVFTFFLQVFFISPGLVSRCEALKSRKEFCCFVGRTFRTIMVPYYLWACIGASQLDENFLKSVFMGTQSALEGKTDSILWFMPVLFVARILFQASIELIWIIFKRDSRSAKCVLAAILLILGITWGHVSANQVFMGVDIAFVAAGLMLCGALLKQPILALHKSRWFIRAAVGAAALGLSIVLAFMNMPYGIDAEGHVIYKTAVWMARGQYGRSGLLFCLSSLTGSLFIFVVAMGLEKVASLARCGQHTLGIMTVHNKVYPLAARGTQCFFTALGLNSVTLWGQGLCTAMALLCSAPWVFLIVRYAPLLEGRLLTKGGEQAVCRR